MRWQIWTNAKVFQTFTLKQIRSIVTNVVVKSLHQKSVGLATKSFVVWCRSWDGHAILLSCQLFSPLSQISSTLSWSLYELSDHVNSSLPLSQISSTLSWSLYELSRHPDVQASLRAEVQAVLGDRLVPGAADVARMPLMKAVVKEVLRCAAVHLILFYFYVSILYGAIVKKVAQWCTLLLFFYSHTSSRYLTALSVLSWTRRTNRGILRQSHILGMYMENIIFNFLEIRFISMAFLSAWLIYQIIKYWVREPDKKRFKVY